jgi:hypothetical protein
LKKTTDLHATFAEELVASSEGNLNDRAQFGQFLGSVGFNVSNSLKVGCKAVSASAEIRCAVIHRMEADCQDAHL